MLKMRLQRVGRKHEPTFRLVLTDSKNSTKSGRFAEVLGSYDPRKMIDSFKAERIKALLSQGVGVTGSVNNLLIKHGIMRGKKVHVSTVPAPKAVEEAAAEEPTVSEAAVQAEEVATEPAPETAQADTPAPQAEEKPSPEASETPSA